MAAPACRAPFLHTFDQIPSFGSQRIVTSLNSLLSAHLGCREFKNFQEFYLHLDRCSFLPCEQLLPNCCSVDLLGRAGYLADVVLASHVADRQWPVHSGSHQMKQLRLAVKTTFLTAGYMVTFSSFIFKLSEMGVGVCFGFLRVLAIGTLVPQLVRFYTRIGFKAVHEVTSSSMVTWLTCWYGEGRELEWMPILKSFS
ncbi:uncharacterized protein LOC131256789 [Magnolia sinica]|uniref:uncharacterized protein LOC131256789 n=1 Tax=Magnolia sinica TaxID=86752 RepID=UPI00265B6DD4|nr:uncharacterized protein LOC131256789 [Magnolia sinica]